MRLLTKIIFINSANIPYAEVMLDGNVHFSGTQGVGKSTVLRALLFFYNADKMRLGIQQGQKSFEEFYFRNSNSYIAYEVATDHGTYTILVSRRSGKIEFRFIDAPFRRDWIVADDGRATSDWIQIRERIGTGTDISAKIDSFEQYRRIIYGYRDSSHRYDKYALLESPKYQSIPRSIQNVFLNSKLDADFVKDTIIRSMSDADDSISLAAYRRHVADFEREFEEIDCWFRKDSKGEIPVRIKADKVVATYRLLLAYDHEILRTWHKLNHSVAHAREQLPLVADRIKEVAAERKKVTDKMEAAKKEFDTDHGKLLTKIGGIQMRLDDIRKKQKHYEKLGIAGIIAFVERESSLKTEKEQKEKTLAALQQQYTDVATRFDVLRDAINAEITAYNLQQQKDVQDLKDKQRAALDKADETCDTEKKNADEAYNEWVAASDERMTSLTAEFQRADKHLAALEFFAPLKAEIDACDKKINGYDTEEKDCKAEIKLTEIALENITNSLQLKQQQIESECEAACAAASLQLETLSAELEATNRMLEQWEGSLYQWLSENRPGWEQNIGKIVDEQHVLYASGLNPQLDEAARGPLSLYGLQIDLDAIPTHHRTPDEYRGLQAEQKAAANSKAAEIEGLRSKCDEDLKALNKAARPAVEEKKQALVNLRVRLGQLPNLKKDEQTTRRTLVDQQTEKIEAEREKRTASFNEAQLALENEKSERQKQKDKHDKAEKARKSARKAMIAQHKKDLKEFEDKQKAEREEKMKGFNDRLEVVNNAERDEMKSKGADTEAIEACRREIEAIETMLKSIEEQRHYVIEYHKDEDELLSHEQEFRNSKKQLQEKDENLFKEYSLREERRKKFCEAYNEQIKVLGKQHEDMSDGLAQYDRMLNVENIVPEYLMADDKTERTTDDCARLISELRGAFNAKHQKADELKRAVNAFNSHFGTNNTFNFIEPVDDDDYPTFALNLMDFLDNNKIEDYRERVSVLYQDILRGISREVGLLMDHSAEVKKIINDINADFRERNFAGVIRSIELRAEESSDALMLLLKSIRDFTEENAMNIGEQNLFSDTDTNRVNARVVEYLKDLMKQLQRNPARTELTLSDAFTLKFRIRENDNDSGWRERINNVGSDGTDILVKAMVNIMLINVFKTKAARRNADFIVHCMMDEIGKLHPSNVAGILQFANVRNIYLINSSPMSYNADIYKHNYLLEKDSRSQTRITRLLSIKA